MAIEEFSHQRQMAKWKEGWREGKDFNNLITPPEMTIEQGWPKESMEKVDATQIKQGTPEDVWNARRANGNK